MTGKTIAIIPARGGSKGLPRKNITTIAGKPLIAWTIEACLQSSVVDETIVSSEDAEILEVAESYGATSLLRPAELATDLALTAPVITHVLESLGKKTKSFDYIVLMQPTSPLRFARHLDEAFSLLVESDATSLISVSEPEHSPLKTFQLKEGFLKGLVNDEYPFMRRQDLPDTYIANGAIYIVKTTNFCKSQSLLTRKCVPYLMSPEDSQDIDSTADLIAAEKRLVELTKHTAIYECK